MNTKFFKAFSGLIVLVGFVSGCAQFQQYEPLDTASGRPEVTVAGVKKGEVIDVLTGIMQDAGYIARKVTDEKAVYYKRTFETYAERPYGTPIRIPQKALREEAPELLVSYDIEEIGEGVHVVATVEIISEPESPFKKSKDISRGLDARDIQRRLDRLKASFK
jgi:hypothetical protein